MSESHQQKQQVRSKMIYMFPWHCLLHFQPPHQKSLFYFQYNIEKFLYITNCQLNLAPFSLPKVRKFCLNI